MSHLLAISVGPVQEFIAAARRTRDLWFGSYLLSEVSKAVAKCIRERQGALIFPPPGTNLEPNHPEINVANVILAELPSGDPKVIAMEAGRAVRDRWLKFTAQAKRDASQAIHNEMWECQVGDVIEFYAAWVLHTNPNDYPGARARVMRLLAGRKNCRDFKGTDLKDAGLPKSSLDGQRPTVLKAGNRTSWPLHLRLSTGEQLDVVGVTKRLGKREGESNPRYPSVARVAAETWLQGFQGVKDRASIEELRKVCDAVPKLNKVAEPCYGYFPYEGTVIYKDRHPDLIAELGEEARDPLRRVAETLKKLGGEPLPYVAVLVADGDGMGAVIANQKTIDEHQRFSLSLAGFADEAQKIVTNHDGVLIYAGGDDVLAFLPVHKCLNCARELHDVFGDVLKEHKNEQEKSPTLSVGVAIGHFMENMEDLREYGQQAEKAAKAIEGKDALAVHLHKRGGSPVQFRAKWSDKPVQRICDFANLINDKTIPGKLPYELRAMAQLYRDWPPAEADAAIPIDLIRLIAKKQSQGVESVKAKLSPHLVDMTAGKLLSFADELLVARHIADALRQAGGGA